MRTRGLIIDFRLAPLCDESPEKKQINQWVWLWILNTNRLTKICLRARGHQATFASAKYSTVNINPNSWYHFWVINTRL